MLEFLLDRKHCIAFLVIGWLVRGMVFHFFPLINDILLWGTILWIGVILIADGIRKKWKFDGTTICLCGVLIGMLISTGLNLSSIQAWKEIELADVICSIIEAAGLFGILFTAAKYEEKESFTGFLNRLFGIVFAYGCLLALASLILFVCYRMNIALPGGFGGADQIFTYGHMGEETRFCGLYGYSTDGGNLCALCAAIAVYLYEQKKLPLWLTAAAILLLAVMIVLLDVRTSMVAFLFIGFLLGGYLLGKKTGMKKAAGILFVLLAVLVAAFIVLKQDTIQYYLERYREDPAKTLEFITTGRSYYWGMAVQGWKEKPLFGWGWLNNAYIGRYFDNHNLFFNLLLWIGAFGTGMFLLFVIQWFITVIRRKPECGIGLVLIIGVVSVQAMLDRAILGTANTGVETMCFWLAAGTLCYAFRESSRKTHS